MQLRWSVCWRWILSGVLRIYCVPKIRAVAFISEQHDQILIGHPTCDKLKVYTLNVHNKAPKFDHSKLLPLLDLDSMNTTNTTISTVQDLKKRYPNQLDVIGNFDGEYNIVTDETVPPVQHPMRKTPIEYQEKIEQELDRMVTQGIITPVKEPTEWVNSMTYPMKPNGDLRICLDPKNLNKAIIREHYKPPTLEEITHKLSGAKVFSKLDAFKGFFAYKLNYKSTLEEADTDIFECPWEQNAVKMPSR